MTSAAATKGDTGHAGMANAIRALAMDAVEAAKSGHPGMPMGMADVATVLFSQVMRYDASDPAWPNRDRFVLSAGHGSMLLYALLHLTGAPGMDIAQLKKFRQLGAKTAGHPEFGHAAGIETTTGPLGQGIANAVGMAIAERIWNARFGSEIIEHHTYCIAGDGCLMEGISHEAIGLAGHLGLGRLIVLFDDNGISIDGPTSLSTSEDHIGRFRAAGWNTMAIDGHDPAAIRAALGEARSDNSKPWLIACKTVIGFGAPKKQGTAATHGSPLGVDEIKGAREALGWPHEPFVVPAAIQKAWAEAGARGSAERKAWEQRWAKVDANLRARFAEPLSGDGRAALTAAIKAAKAAFAADASKRATRNWSELTLEKITAAMPALIGGSADLTGSNNTKAKSQAVIKRGDFGGSYIHYGVREHGMAAAMNGMALYGGLVPYGGTFLVFTDYCRPSIRLSALMRRRVIYVMTHELDRARRGRADAPAGRASGGASLHAEPQRVPAGRRAGDRGVLGTRHPRPGDAVDPGAVAAGGAQSAWRGLGREPVRTWRLRHAGADRQARRDADRDRLGSGPRRRRGRGAGQDRRSRGGRLDAVVRAVSPSTGGLSRGRPRGGAADRHRGGGRAVLAGVAAARRPIHRNVGFRRVGTGTQAVRAFRFDDRQDRRGGKIATEALSEDCGLTADHSFANA